MNRTQQIQRWRRYRRAKGGLHIGRWIVAIGVGILAFNLVIAFSFVFLSIGSAAGLYSAYAQNLPDPTSIQTEQASYETVKIYDRTGKHLLYESIDPRPARGDRTYLGIAEIPQMVRDATIALEDRSFYTNIGVNPRGLGRAFLSNLRGGSVQGASSITQQLVKNVLIDPKERYQQSYARKIKEAVMAIEITRKYPGREGKNQILEWYLNYNFYGNAAYGIEAAANVYYNKPVKDLALDEIAVLAAIPQYPGLNPFQSPADAYRRQRKVLVSMVEAGYLTQEQADAATRYFNTPLLNDLADKGLLDEGDLPLVATGDRPATARALNAMVKADLLSQEEADAAKKLPGPLWQYTRESAQERYEIPPDAPHFAILVLQQLQEKYNTPEAPYFIWENGLKVYYDPRLGLADLRRVRGTQPHRFAAFADTKALPERPRGVARRPRGAEAEVRSRGHQRLCRRHPAQHRRGIDDGGQPGLLRRRDRRPGERIAGIPPTRLIVQALHLPDRVRERRVCAVEHGHGCPHGVPRPRQPALHAGELRPQVPRPADAAPGFAALLQHPGRVADESGGSRQCHQDRPPPGRQQPEK